MVAVMTDARSSRATIAVHVPEESDGDILIPELAGSSQAPAVQIRRRAGARAKCLYCCCHSKYVRLQNVIYVFAVNLTSSVWLQAQKAIKALESTRKHFGCCATTWQNARSDAHTGSSAVYSYTYARCQELIPRTDVLCVKRSGLVYPM